MNAMYNKRLISGSEFLRQSNLIALKTAVFIETTSSGFFKCTQIKTEDKHAIFLHFTRNAVVRIEHVDGVGALASVQRLPDAAYVSSFLEIWCRLGTEFTGGYKVVSRERNNDNKPVGLVRFVPQVFRKLFHLMFN